MKPGRFKIVCDKCKKEFSTHSTNRTFCYNCKPKCRDRNYFPPKPKIEKKAEKGKE